MTSDAQLKSEIARLTATINQHKSSSSSSGYPYRTPRNNSYVNPTYRPPANKYIRSSIPPPSKPPSSRSVPPPVQGTKDVILNGVAFESSSRSLVRKDCVFDFLSLQHFQLLSVPKSTPVPTPNIPTARPRFKNGPRIYKPKSSRRRGPVNMTLTNNRRPYQSRREMKRLKYSEKPCPRFSTTGSCARGLTCAYAHDPAKIAVCWNFLQGTCSKTAETCDLSHDPTPERTPLCVHFLNKGRCTRDACPFPHVNVGTRSGVCRDFAVLGYCARGLDCDKQHVRECPDFAEHGTCTKKGCKLPHVIRANRNRKPQISANSNAKSATALAPLVSSSGAPKPDSSVATVTVEDAQLGDEFISLTFNESESETGDDDSEDGESSEDDESDSDESASVADGDGPPPPEAM